MKVLLQTPDLRRPGGVSAFCGTLAGALKCEVDLFASAGQRTYARIPAPLRLPFDYFRYFIRLANNPYDVIHLNPSFRPRALIRDGIFLLLAKCLRKKVIVFIHGWDLDYAERVRNRWLWLFRRTYFLADAFIVLCADFKSRLASMGYAGPIYLGKTALDGFLVQFLDDNPPTDPSLLPFNILFLSRVEREKGIFEALEAYRLLRSEDLDVTLTVAGDGRALAEAKQFVESRNMPGVRFVGHVSGKEKASLLRRAHCYLFPSYEEGMPISVLEAMAFGLPIITRQVGALVDFFSNGTMGFMTESKSSQVFAQLVRKLMTDPAAWNDMSKYNRKYAREHFTPLQVAAEIESIYGHVLNNSRPGL